MIKDIKKTGLYSVSGLLLGILQGILIGRNWGPEGKGFIAMITASINLIFPLVSNGARQFIAVSMGIYNVSLRDVLAVIGIISIFSWFVLKLLGITLAGVIHESYIFLILSTLAVSHVMSGVALAKGNSHFYNLNKFLPTLLTFILIIVAITVKYNYDIYLSIIVMSNLLVSILYLNYGIRNLHFENTFSLKLIKDWLFSGWRYSIPLLFTTLNFRVDIIFISYFLDDTSTGYYSTSLSIAELLLLSPNILAVVLFSRSLSDDTGQSIKRALKLVRLTMIFSPILMLIIYIVAPFIIPLVYGKSFLPSVPLLNYLLLVVYSIIPFTILNPAMMANKVTNPSLITLLIASLLNIILNILLIPIMGVNAAVLASGISYSLASSLLYIHVKKVFL